MKQKKAILMAVLAAAFYALNAPVSKLLLSRVPSTLMAGFLYLGAGIGLSLVHLAKKASGIQEKEQPLTHAELPYTTGMILLDIAAPIFLMIGLKYTSAANVSLLNNFEIVATSIIAFFLFHEKISRKLGAAIVLITLSSILLSFEDMSALQFSGGSLLVLAACICWGFENNCTRRMSSKDPLQIVIIKGFCSGTGSLIIGLVIGERFFEPLLILCVLLLGFTAYGLSIFFYIYAQRDLGAARTSAYYAIAPFIGVLLSLLLFHEIPASTFYLALLLMIAGSILAA